MQDKKLDLFGENKMARPVTTLEERRFLELYNLGLTDREVGKRVGRPNSTIACWRKRNDLPPNGEYIGRPHKLYTIYKKNSDELLAFGSAKECADRLGMKIDSFYSAVTRARKGQREKYNIFVEEVVEEDDED